MKRLIVLLLGLALSACMHTPAAAQQGIQAFVVSACGTNGFTPPVGTFSWVTMTPDGKFCDQGGGGGGGGGVAGLTAEATASAVAVGTNKPQSEDIVNGAARIEVCIPGSTTCLDLSQPSGIFGVDGSTLASRTNPVPTTPKTNSLVSGLTVAMTGTTSTAVTGMGAPGANLHNYITTIVCGNSHATVGTFVDLQDGSGGTVFWTIPAAAVYGGAAPALPIPLQQPTANTALFAKDQTTGANVICSVAGFTGS